MNTLDLICAHLSTNATASQIELTEAIGRKANAVQTAISRLLLTGEVEVAVPRGRRKGPRYRLTAGIPSISEPVNVPDDEVPEPTMPEARVVHFALNWRCEPAQTNRLTIGANNLGI